jgi:peptide/nickel transport system permease protein
VLPAVSVFPAGDNPLSHPDILVLPVAALLAVSLAQNARLVRAGVAEASASDAVEAARLNGIPEHRVLWRMVLPVAIVPALPALARNVSYLLGGTLVAETLFGYPGLAATLVEAVASRDVPVVQAVALLVTVVTVALNLAADLLRVLLDPRRGEAA